MKKIIFLFAFVAFSINLASAQMELKVNAFGLAFGNYGGTFEYVLNERSGINTAVSYF